jgi:lipopolysaccharide/colanic/teichoic acid biosynthesis glycosyltransferase
VTGPAADRVTRGRPYPSKRIVDLAVLAVLSVPAAILGALAAVAVRVSSRGPVLFRQERIGRDGRPFVLLKFRTMTDADHPVLPHADHITPVGRWLRRTSLDELPNLINVARGEMSIVGPRPTLAYQVERYDDRQRRRLDSRPGLTGLAQVNGRNALSWTERIELDLTYVDTQSARLDLQILARTAGVVVSGSGVDGHAVDDPLSSPD